jgi:hypothetical protein
VLLGSLAEARSVLLGSLPEARSLPVALHRRRGANLRFVGVLAGVAVGPPLAQQVPTLVQLNFQRAQTLTLRVRKTLAGMFSLKAVFLLDEIIDTLHDLRVIHRPPRYAAQTRLKPHLCPLSQAEGQLKRHNGWLARVVS